MTDHEDDGLSFELDPLRLDRDWCRQAEDVRHHYKKLADRKLERDELKRELEVAEADAARVEAEVYLDVTRDPSRYDLAKPTVDSMKAVVKASGRVLEAQDRAFALKKKLNRAHHEVGIVEAVCKALDHKRDGLESMARLHLGGYFAEPRAGKDVRGVAEAQGDARVKDFLRRKGGGRGGG